MIGQTTIYRTLFEEINDAVLILSSDGEIVEHNRAVIAILGYQVEELRGVNVWQFFVEQSQFQEIISMLDQELPVRDYEVQLTHKEQHIVHCALTTYRETDHNNDTTNYLIILKNITRQLHTEQALNERLRFEAGMSAAASSLLSDSAFALSEALRQLMLAADVGRVSLIKGAYKPDGTLFFKLTNEVDIMDLPGTSSVKDEEFPYPTEFFPTSEFEKVRQDFLIKSESIIQVSSLAGEARALFESRNVKSMLLLPLQVQEQWIGFLLFSDLEQERRWAEHNIDLLHASTSMIGTYLSRKKAQDELENQQRFLRQVIDLNPEFVFVKDKNGRYTLVNQAFADRYQMSVEEIIGKSDEVLNFNPEKVKAFRDADLAILDAKQSVTSQEDEVFFPDGSVRWLQTTKRPIFDAAGEPTHLLALSVDMTTQKKVEQALRENERLLQNILDTIPQGVFWKDHESLYLGCNKVFADLIQIDPKEIKGKTDFDFAWDKEEAEVFQKDDHDVIHSGQSKLKMISRRKRFDDSFVWTETNKVPLRDDDDNIFGILGSVQDISEAMQLRSRVEESLDRRSRQVTLSTQIAQEVANATDLNQLYERVVSQVKEQFGYYHVQLLQYDPALDTVVLIAGYGDAGQKMLALNHALPMGVGLIGTAADTGQSVLRPHISRDPNWRANPILPKTKGEIAVPIKSRTKVLGVLDVQSDEPGALSEDDQLLLEGLCGQIAIAIESTNLRQDLESQLRELVQLQRRLSREAWDKYNQVIDENQNISGFQYDHLGIRPFDAQTGAFNEFQQRDPLSTTALITKPVTIRGEVVGHMGVKEINAIPLDEEEETFLNAIALEVAGALEAARLFEEIETSLLDQARLATELETVAKVSTAAATVLDSDYLLQSVVDLAKDSFGLYHAHVYLISEKGDYLELVAGSGSAGQLMTLEGHRILITEDSLTARAARNREGVMENDVRKTVDFLPNPMLPDTKAEIAVPMIVGDKIIGVLDLQADSVGAFSEDDLRIYRILASQVAVAHENAKQYTAQVETAKKLREVDIVKSEFLASMSHELRTPLNSIIGFADVMLEGLDGELNERMEEDVGLIRQSGAHLRELIGDILDMSKIEAGKMDLRYELIDISRMVQDIMKTANPLAQEKSLELLLDLDDSIAEIPADRTRLRQILWNIMGNAIKFTEKGSVTLRIAAKADHLLVSIKDSGIGIEESHISLVFEQFRQVDGSLERKAGGAGLGMPISKRLVELHGGDIWVESVLGQGSTFFFTLPYEPSANIN